MAANSTAFRVPSFFRDLSLRTKIISVISATSLVMVLLSVLCSFFIELDFFRDRIEKEHRTTARIIASNLEVPFAFASFSNSTDAQEILNTLMRQYSVVRACAFLADGKLLAEYRREGAASIETVITIDTPEHFDWRELVISEPVTVEGATIGRVVIIAELDELYHFMLGRTWLFLSLFAVAFVVVLFLAAKMGKLVSKPILDLAETAQQISSDQDYSRRHARTSNDETGHLVDAFNAMMVQIESRGEIVKANTERLQRYFELGVVGMGILDASMRWYEANDRMFEILGYEPGQLKNRPWNEFLSSDQSESHMEGLRSIMTGRNDRFSGECWLKANAGRRVFAMVSLRRVEPTRAHPLHFIVLVQDLTERKVDEEHLLRAKEEAEASNRAKDEFLSIMSHELRTPLNPIIGFGELLQEEAIEGEHRSYLDVMMNSARHLLALIDDILNYVRIERRSVDCPTDSIDFHEVLENAMSFVAADASERGLRMQIFHREEGRIVGMRGVARLFIDAKLLRQVVLNLLGNAIKFTDVGHIELNTCLRYINSEKGVLRVEVVDTGVGIPEASVRRIFEAFTQLEESLTRSHGGIGLGLAICRKIIDAMEGELGVSSKVGEGSVFWFEVPVRYEIEPMVNQSADVSPGLSLDPIQGQVLLVEDDTSNRLVAEAILRRFGTRVDFAVNGLEAIALFQQKHFNLILMDVQMPQMNGYDATRKIRELEGSQNGRIPIIGVTAHVASQTQDACREAGMDDYLAKPYKASELERILRKWLIVVDPKT